MLTGIQELRTEKGVGEQGARAGRMERAGNNGASGYKQKATGNTKVGKRLPMRTSRTKNKSLSRR